MRRLYDSELIVDAVVPVPHPSVLMALIVAGVIAVLPFLTQVHPEYGVPTTGMVDLSLVTAALFLVVVYRGRGSTGEQPN